MREKFYCFALVFILTTSLIPLPILGISEKWIQESEIHPRISAAADQSEAVFGNFQSTWYFDGAKDPRSGQPDDGWVRSWLRNSGSVWGCRNWKDPETGTIYPVKLGGANYGKSEPTKIQFPVPDLEGGLSICRYYRYRPPKIIVNGIPIQRAFGIGDFYAPNKVWGTADVMVETHSRTWLGLDIYQRVLVWVSKNHNQYVIYDWTVVNTGNVDLDPEIEREGEALDSLYFMRELEMTVNSEDERKSEWYTWSGVYPPESPNWTWWDSVRCLISYAALEYDRYGYSTWGDAYGSFMEYDYLDDCASGCEVTLFAPKTDANHKPIKPIGPGPNASSGKPENYPENDDVTQPRAHGFHGPDDLKYKHHSIERPPDEWEVVYNAMIYGEKGDPTYDPYVEYMEGTYPSTYHPKPTDKRGVWRWNDLEPDAQVFWHIVGWSSMGPFHLEYGDSLRIVWANCGGRLSEETAWRVGKAWKDSSITFVTKSGDTIDINDISYTFPHVPNPKDTIHIPPVYRHFPVWQDPGHQCDRANLIKDMWVYTTVDSAIRHAINAQWNFDHDYLAPVPPPPPSIEVTSMPNYIYIKWWYEEEADKPSDLAGFKVYRSRGRAGPLLTNEGVAGKWELVFQCGGSNPGGGVDWTSDIVYEYKDQNVIRGENYYYYVAAFDDGTHPETPYPGDVKGSPEPLESGRWQNYTFGVIGAASLQREAASDLSNVRVVPNPFNAATVLGRYGEGSDKINFFGLTEDCTIRIYTFTGDLIKTINHKGSGDEAWVNPTKEIYQVTEEGQHLASDIYIANIVDNKTGETVNVKFVIIR
ncbi:MAG: hypothetical protein ABIN61_04720 [candidate division WOR-3 bacterium]